MAIRSNGARLNRALHLGRELGGIDRDPGLHALSRAAWVRKCVELGRFNGVEDLKAAMRQIETSCPRLWGEVTVRAKLWRDSNQTGRGPIRALVRTVMSVPMLKGWSPS